MIGSIKACGCRGRSTNYATNTHFASKDLVTYCIVSLLLELEIFSGRLSSYPNLFALYIFPPFLLGHCHTPDIILSCSLGLPQSLFFGSALFAFSIAPANCRRFSPSIRHSSSEIFFFSPSLVLSSLILRSALPPILRFPSFRSVFIISSPSSPPAASLFGSITLPDAVYSTLLFQCIKVFFCVLFPLASAPLLILRLFRTLDRIAFPPPLYSPPLIAIGTHCKQTPHFLFIPPQLELDIENLIVVISSSSQRLNYPSSTPQIFRPRWVYRHSPAPRAISDFASQTELCGTSLNLLPPRHHSRLPSVLLRVAPR